MREPMTYDEAVALIDEDPEATYVAQIDGEYITLKGWTMRGFLLASDTLDHFSRF